MAATASYNCVNCGGQFTARVADRKRGWARYCSKSCKATKQTQRRGPHKARAPSYYCGECGEPARKFLGAGQVEYLCEHHAALWEHPFSSEALGQW